MFFGDVNYGLCLFCSNTEANIKPILFSHTLIKDKAFPCYLRP